MACLKSSCRPLFNRKITRAIFITVAATGIIFFVLHSLFKDNPFLQTQDLGKMERNRIIGMMRHAWNGYEKYAFGSDHLKPITKTSHEWLGLGISILDAVDTSYIMGEMHIYEKCRKWIKDEFKIDPESYNISVFETNIRVVGGFLSTYALTKDQLFLDKAIKTADELLLNFHRVTGISYRIMGHANGTTSVADTGTFALNFKYLSFLTNDAKYWNASIKISKIFRPMVLKAGILGSGLDVETGIVSGVPTIGAGADSFYEYIAKQYIQTNRVEEGFPPQWEEFMKKVRQALKTSSKNEFMFVDGGYGSVCHLDCFLAGTIALYAIQGAKNAFSHKLTMSQLQDIDLAEELARGCYELYHQTATNLSPERVRWDIKTGVSDALKIHSKPLNDKSLMEYSKFNGTSSRLPPINANILGDFRIEDPKYKHRPETLETLFYLYRITGKKIYRDMGWQIFLAYEKHLKMTDSGYAGLYDVNDLQGQKIDLMESFLFGETLKYLYLLFSDESVIPLDKFVFNTEAHPLPIFNISLKFRALIDWL